MLHVQKKILNMYICGMTIKCHQCQSTFSCSQNTDCWCCELPAIVIPEEGKNCVCPNCLKLKVDAKKEDLIDKKEFGFIKSLGLPEILKENIDFNYNEAGLMVFTKWYHLRRGYCCENDCENCAYK